jgi:hypothetical protein
VVNALMNLTGKTTKDFIREEDKRGNQKTLVDKKVETNLPETFVLTVPLYEGQPAQSFKVEIAIDDRDGGLSVWLESDELFSLQLENRDALIGGVVNQLEERSVLCIHSDD